MADAIISAAERLLATYRERFPKGDDEELFLSLSDRLAAMRDVLDDADNRRFKEQSVNDWLSWLERSSFELDGVVDRWDYSILQQRLDIAAPTEQKSGEGDIVEDSKGAHDSSELKEGYFLDDISEKLVAVVNQIDQILEKKDVYSIGIHRHSTPSQPHSTPLVDSTQVHGRDSDMDTLIPKLISDSEDGSGVQLLSIAGMPGIGKTALAQLIYNDARVQDHFKLRIWVPVSDHFDVVGIAKAIIDAVKKSPANPVEMLVNNLTDFIGANKNEESPNVEIVLSSLRDRIKGKKFLLVFDGVIAADDPKLEQLKDALSHGGEGSKILLTTVNGMSKTLNSCIHRLAPLSESDSWAVMKRAALFGRSAAEDERFYDIGERMAQQCRGLPLAAKAVGEALSSKKTFVEWETLLVSQVWEKDVFPRFLSSYNELSAAQKRCFSYCAIFPKNSRIEVARVVEMWMALGYLGCGEDDMERKGRECFDTIAEHSLFQDFERVDFDGRIESFKLHEILHDFAAFTRKRSLESEEREEECEICHPLLVSRLREYCSVFLQTTPFLTLCPCFSSTRLLKTKYRKGSFPQGVMENLIHLRWLDLSYSSLSIEDVRSICKLYSLQTLLLGRCGLTELPSEMSNLINLRHLSLMGNNFEELPEIVCSLLELRILNVDYSDNLCSLPGGICRLTKLKHFSFEGTKLRVFPKEVGQLDCLNTLSEFRVGSGWNKWGLLRDLNELRGSLKLWIKVTEGVEEIQEAELEKKVNIQEHKIIFEDEMDDEEDSSMAIRSDTIGALNLNPNLRYLKMWDYKGLKLPLVASKFDQLKEIHLYGFIHLQSLPPLGELARLEEVYMSGMKGLKMVGREFLGMKKMGITEFVAFPRLKNLTFYDCSEWSEWEDITAEEEESAAVSIMPCLKTLMINNCTAMKKLPYRLLRKAAAMEELNLYGSNISSYSLPRPLSKNPLFRLKA